MDVNTLLGLKVLDLRFRSRLRFALNSPALIARVDGSGFAVARRARGYGNPTIAVANFSSTAELDLLSGLPLTEMFSNLTSWMSLWVLAPSN